MDFEPIQNGISRGLGLDAIAVRAHGGLLIQKATGGGATVPSWASGGANKQELSVKYQRNYFLLCKVYEGEMIKSVDFTCMATAFGPTAFTVSLAASTIPAEDVKFCENQDRVLDLARRMIASIEPENRGGDFIQPTVMHRFDKEINYVVGVPELYLYIMVSGHDLSSKEYINTDVSNGHGLYHVANMVSDPGKDAVTAHVVGCSLLIESRQDKIMTQTPYRSEVVTSERAAQVPSFGIPYSFAGTYSQSEETRLLGLLVAKDDPERVVSGLGPKFDELLTSNSETGAAIARLKEKLDDFTKSSRFDPRVPLYITDKDPNGPRFVLS